MNIHRFVWLLSNDDVNQWLAPGMGDACGLNVLGRFPEEGLPGGDCGGLVVDLDSVAAGRRELKRLVKELSRRLYPYPVAVFSFSLQDEQILDLRDAGILVFQRCMCPAVFAAIAQHLSDAPSDNRRILSPPGRSVQPSHLEEFAASDTSGKVSVPSIAVSTQIRVNANESGTFASITDGYRVSLCQVLHNLQIRVGRDGISFSGFEQKRKPVKARTLTSEEVSLAVKRLSNARRYLQSGERGAARYELRLLRGSLET
jgi:hypothetical protein